MAATVPWSCGDIYSGEGQGFSSLRSWTDESSLPRTGLWYVLWLHRISIKPACSHLGRSGPRSRKGVE